MRSVVRFVVLMAIGIGIVMIFIWSGESLIVLALTIITLFAVLGIWLWRPWEAAGSGIGLESGGNEALDVVGGSDTGEVGPCWRNPFDITWDDRGLSGVLLGAQAPQMWTWSQIDDIGYDWFTDGLEERLAFRVSIPDVQNPAEPVEVWVMFGPEQEPMEVWRQAKATMGQAKVKRSSFHALEPLERTALLAEHLAPQTLDLTDGPQSPELFYQEVRRALLDGGELCRLTSAASSEEVLDAFDRLLGAHNLDPVTESEADELASAGGQLASAGIDCVASMHRTLDWVAEQRGLRLVFIDQVSGAPSADYLMGLIPASAADDWDGQTVGSGSAQVTLDCPSG